VYFTAPTDLEQTRRLRATSLETHMQYRSTEQQQRLAAGPVDPSIEEAYWRRNFTSRPYVSHGTIFNEYRPAYRYGIDAHRRFQGRPYEQVEPELMRDWNHIKGTSSLTWEDATLAARDAWQKVADIVAPSTPGNVLTTGT